MIEEAQTFEEKFESMRPLLEEVGSKIYLHDSCINERLISYGSSKEIIRDVTNEELHNKLEEFMQKFSIDEGERDSVMDFYQRVYAIFRVEVEKEMFGGKIDQQRPLLWGARLKFLKECKATTRGRNYIAQKAVFHLQEKYNFSWIKFNTEVLPPHGAAYMLTTAFLHDIDKKARANTFEYMCEQMQNREWYDLYRISKIPGFEELKSKE